MLIFFIFRHIVLHNFFAFQHAAAVKDIDRYQEKITVSLQKASLSPSMEHIKLGVVASDELPKHYR